MIKMVMATDNCDCQLGDFFSCSANAIKNLFSIKKVNIADFSSDKIQNDIGITIHLSKLSNSFIFIALTHGSESELSGSDNLPYISASINAHYLKNSLSFCFSCNTGKSLGKSIVFSGGKCFVGHDNTIYASNFVWKELFVKPIICFWERFIKGETVFSCIKAKKEEYTRLIDETYETDIFHATYLLNNRDSLVIYGDGNCTIEDFNKT